MNLRRFLNDFSLRYGRFPVGNRLLFIFCWWGRDASDASDARMWERVLFVTCVTGPGRIARLIDRKRIFGFGRIDRCRRITGHGRITMRRRISGNRGKGYRQHPLAAVACACKIQPARLQLVPPFVHKLLELLGRECPSAAGVVFARKHAVAAAKLSFLLHEFKQICHLRRQKQCWFLRAV